MGNTRSLATFNALAFALHLTTSVAVQRRWINEEDVGEVSDAYPTLLTPASFTFSIWGLIYAALLTFCIYHLYAAWKKEAADEANSKTRALGPWFLITHIATAGWLVAWVNELLVLSVALIIIQLFSLVVIHRRLRIYDATKSVYSRMFTQLPISIHLAWISIAAMVNISVWLTQIGWSRWDVSPTNWTLTLIAVSVLLAIHVINRTRDVAFGMVVIWALYGILGNLNSQQEAESEPIAWVLKIGMAIIGAACMFGFVRNLGKR